MTVAGIETSTDVCSVGIDTGQDRFERSIRESRIHSEKLLTLLEEVLGDAGRVWDDIEGLAVSSGPGSFTGLRIGASAAKGLIAGGGKLFAAVPTFDGMFAAASRSGTLGSSMTICLDAKQDEWYVQEASDGLSTGPVRVLASAEMREAIAGRTVLTDRVDAFPSDADVHDLRAWCRGDVIAELGRKKLLNGPGDDAGSFEPSYWKDFVVRAARKAVPPRTGA